MHDDELIEFEAHGAAPLPTATVEGFVENEGARIWYAAFGDGLPVLLMHGGLGNSRNWGYQVVALVSSGYRAVVVDSRGHGRSTRDSRRYTYELMASDVLAVMDKLGLKKTALVGWSDGACVTMVLGMKVPERVAGVFFFGCNMDPSGTKEFQFTPIIERCFHRLQSDYAALSSTPDQFEEFSEAVGVMMQTEPNYSAEDLAKVHVPVEIVQSENDEFIKPEHAAYLAQTIPGAKLKILPEVSHFAPLQRPEEFNAEMLSFVQRVFA